MEAILVFLILFAAFIAVVAVSARIDNVRQKNNKNEEQNQPPPNEELDMLAEAHEEFETNKRDLSTQIILGKIKERYMRHLIKRDGSEALKCVYEAMGCTDPERDVIARHFFLLDALDMMYGLRDEDSEAYMACITICEYDMLSIDALCRAMGRSFNMVSPTRACIIFERFGMYEDALEICDTCIERGVLDGSHKTFHARRERLAKKMQKGEEQCREKDL